MGAEKDDHKLLQLPVARVKKLMKMDKDLLACSNESVVLITKATELFIKMVSERALEETHKAKRKTVQYDDLANAVKKNDEFEFLQDVVPPKITIKEATQRKKE